MILGDPPVLTNSLLHYAGLGAQVQTISIDPAHGVKFGRNLQPFVRKCDLKHIDDGAMTRERKTVHRYRDAWGLGLTADGRALPSSDRANRVHAA
jgi:adenine-specific DNA-methyltransferase